MTWRGPQEAGTALVPGLRARVSATAGKAAWGTHRPAGTGHWSLEQRCWKRGVRPKGRILPTRRRNA